MLTFNAKLFHSICYVHKFKHRIIFYKFLELFINIFISFHLTNESAYEDWMESATVLLPFLQL